MDDRQEASEQLRMSTGGCNGRGGIGDGGGGGAQGGEGVCCNRNKGQLTVEGTEIKVSTCGSLGLTVSLLSHCWCMLQTRSCLLSKLI